MSTEIPVRDIDIVVSKSDEEGNITYGNPIFVKLSGYDQGELLGKPHSILRHPDMPKVIFEYLWDRIKKGETVKAFVINKSKSGDFYRVFAVVKPAKNPDGSFRNYTSTRRTSNPKAWEILDPLYKELRELEESEGMEASRKRLAEFLSGYGADLNGFSDVMEKLQKL